MVSNTGWEFCHIKLSQFPILCSAVTNDNLNSSKVSESRSDMDTRPDSDLPKWAIAPAKHLAPIYTSEITMEERTAVKKLGEKRNSYKVQYPLEKYI